MAVLLVSATAALVTGAVAAALTSRRPTRGATSPHGAVRRVARWLIRHPRTLDAVERRLDASTAAGLALGAFLVVAVAGFAVVGLLLGLLAAGSQLAELDEALARWGARNTTDAEVEVLLFLTRFGATEYVVAVAAVILAVELARRRGHAVFAYLFTVIAGVSAILNLVKWIVGRDRPAVSQLANFAGASFPSGHAATAAASFAAFALVLGRHRPRAVQVALAGLAATVAAATAASRVFLGVHWLSDVLAGIAIGWAWFAVSTIAFGGRLLRLGAPIEVAERVEEMAADATLPEQRLG